MSIQSLPLLRSPISRVLAVTGTGIVVMLADTDAGSIITAAQSGAQRGYQLLLLQFLLIPILFMVQELTVRLGVVTGRGHGELIREQFGRGWAWLSVSTLAAACIGALISELSGLAGVGLLFGVPAWATVSCVIAGLVVMVWTGSYRSVERVAIIFGALELLFIWIAWRAHPDPRALLGGMTQMPLNDHGYLYLATANIGAVIMPWMIFYQQSAVIEKRLRPSDLRILRWETAGGAVIAQLVMIGVLVATAATIGRTNPNAPLNTVQQISDAIDAVSRHPTRTHRVRRGHERCGDRRHHRRIADGGVGRGRGGRLPPLAHRSSARGAVVLWHFHGLPHRGRRSRRVRCQSREAERRRAGAERAAASDRAGLPLCARHAGTSRTLPAQGALRRRGRRDLLS